jgi:hypothetical protein
MNSINTKAEEEVETKLVMSDTFGPSKVQLKSYDTWSGCDGQFFYPYNKRVNIGKICDFVTAAIDQKKKEDGTMPKYKLRQA